MDQQPPESRASSSDSWEKEDKAAKALEALRRNYSDRDFSGFFDWVSDDYRQGWADLRSDLSSGFSGTGSADLNFVLNRTLPEGDKVAIQVHWQKRTFAARTGAAQKSEGSAEFVFQINPTGKPELIDIRGHSPF